MMGDVSRTCTKQMPNSFSVVVSTIGMSRMKRASVFRCRIVELKVEVSRRISVANNISLDMLHGQKDKKRDLYVEVLQEN